MRMTPAFPSGAIRSRLGSSTGKGSVLKGLQPSQRPQAFCRKQSSRWASSSATRRLPIPSGPVKSSEPGRLPPRTRSRRRCRMAPWPWMAGSNPRSPCTRPPGSRDGREEQRRGSTVGLPPDRARPGLEAGPRAPAPVGRSPGSPGEPCDERQGFPGRSGFP